MNHFVIDNPVHALVGRKCFEDGADRCQSNTDQVARVHSRRPVPKVAEVLQEEGDRLLRLILKEMAMVQERILGTTSQMRNNVRVGRIVVENIEVLRLQRSKGLGFGQLSRSEKREAQRKRSKEFLHKVFIVSTV